jgi:predicted nucleic acid-binding Zn ribbon protein
VSGAFPDDRDPQTLDVALTRVVDDHGWQVDLKVASMFARWGELVGPEVGAHSGPESFADGKLVVRTDSTAWATQLKLLAPAIVRRLNEDLGHGTVLVIDILGPHAPSWKRGQRSVRDGRGPRDTYG